jgi:DNA-binding GntR family transcriptional regulator
MLDHDQSDWNLNVAEPITPQVYRLLRARIISTDLKPGNRISEAEIAKTCRVSRQPVREAFIKLSEQGLLAILPQRGTIVSKISYTSVLNARFLREAIEADFVRILTSAPDATVVRDLRRQIARQKQTRPGEQNVFIQQDETFHRTLADAAGMGEAWKLLEGLKSQMDRVRFMALSHFPMKKLIHQHEDVVDQIAAGDHTGADTAIRLHLREILIDLPRIFEANPGFFDLPASGLPKPVTTPIQGGGHS